MTADIRYAIRLLARSPIFTLTAFLSRSAHAKSTIRLALGSSSERVLWPELRRAGRLAAIGTAVGLVLAVLCSLLLQRLLIDLAPVDPAAFGLAILLLSGVMVAASIVPARRATRMDPMRALRSE